MVINQMLDTIDNGSYLRFVKPLHKLIAKVNDGDIEQRQQVLEKLDFLLEVMMPLISVQPVIITIGCLRITFLVREELPHWQQFLDEARLQFGIKFKSYKVNDLLQGL